MKIDPESPYFHECLKEYLAWCEKMSASPSLLNATTHGFQRRLNNLIPEKIHQGITSTIKEITRAVISGSVLTTVQREHKETFMETEAYVRERINFYTNSSAAEGAITGFGGFFSGLADFPLWLTLKMKMLFEIAYAYGADISDYRERLYILYTFQLTFSSQEHRREIFEQMKHWEENADCLPADFHEFDWRTFQLEYRDYIDLAKLVQLIPGFGAIAGAVVNHKYTKKLGGDAMNAFRLRQHEFRNLQE